MVGAPWFVPNKYILSDCSYDGVNDSIKKQSVQYLSRLKCHPNILAKSLLKNKDGSKRRLKRVNMLKLTNRFN